MQLILSVSVLPFHFREVVLVYSLTRSRMALSLLAAGSPNGSYTAVRKWLEQLGKLEGQTCTQSGDILAIFDNNQVLQRRWRISVDNTVQSSVVTMLMFIQIDAEVGMPPNYSFTCALHIKVIDYIQCVWTPSSLSEDPICMLYGV